MSHGLANTATLYDKDGNPVNVKIIDSEYRLVTVDEKVVDSLDDIKLLLMQVIELLKR